MLCWRINLESNRIQNKFSCFSTLKLELNLNLCNMNQLKRIIICSIVVWVKSVELNFVINIHFLFKVEYFENKAIFLEPFWMKFPRRCQAWHKFQAVSNYFPIFLSGIETWKFIDNVGIIASKPSLKHMT